MQKRVGYYCWAGPGTIRMTNLKFFHPQIDIESVMTSYDYEYLALVQEKFGITDVWATYSWGFSEKTEQEDYQFLISKLPNFKKLGLRVHAYIQGPNVVESEFPEIDWYCQDQLGRRITYHKGRRMICINNPLVQEYFFQKIRKMKNLGVDGIYLDNLVMGQVPLPRTSYEIPQVFAGCRCKICQQQFKKVTGEIIPTDLEKNAELSQLYVNWRVNATSRFITQISNQVHEQHKVFGCNGADPKYDVSLMYGYFLNTLENIQDYLLFESLTFPLENDEVMRIAKNSDKPVFTVNYRKGIGSDSAYSQQDIDQLFSQAKSAGVHLCVKGSEYFTNGVWHNLKIQQYSKPTFVSDKTKKSQKNKKQTNEFAKKVLRAILLTYIAKILFKTYYNPGLTALVEHKSTRWLYYQFQKLI